MPALKSLENIVYYIPVLFFFWGVSFSKDTINVANINSSCLAVEVLP